jgi:HD-GYP domain-containing protein (c-di-GMP phosphodiesterase class II)
MALRLGGTQVVSDMATESTFEPWVARAAEFELRSSVSVCLNQGDRMVVVNIYDRSVDAFDPDTVAGLEQILTDVEFGLAHVRSLKRLVRALDGTLGALSEMTETRDPYTEGHQKRVGLLASGIAARMNLSSSLVELIRQSGEVHDVGKIAIPSEILTRPGRLKPLEYEMIKEHSQVGFDILSRAALPWPIAEIALQHHERLDGSGYPNGLFADDIVLPARIVAVADVVEAMTNHRPYRSALGVERALAEIAAGAGTLFDADVVKACIELFESGFDLGIGLS